MIHVENYNTFSRYLVVLDTREFKSKREIFKKIKAFSLSSIHRILNTWVELGYAQVGTMLNGEISLTKRYVYRLTELGKNIKEDLQRILGPSEKILQREIKREMLFQKYISILYPGSNDTLARRLERYLTSSKLELMTEGFENWQSELFEKYKLYLSKNFSLKI